MRSAKWPDAVVLAALSLSIGCADSDYDHFKDRLEAGASCAELYQLRNEVDSDDPVLRQMNEDLRRIGCYHSSAQRTDK